MTAQGKATEDRSMFEGATPLDGIFVWVWRADWHGESVAQTLARCRDHGVEGLLVRAWNGERASAPDGYDFFQQYRRFVEAAGELRVLPWTYVYGPALGNRPEREADSFADAVAPFDPPLVVVDIEHEGESREYGGQPRATVRLFERLVERLGRSRVAFAPYDRPAYHSLLAPDGVSIQRRDGLAYQAMAQRAALAVPQMYFAGRSVRGAAALSRMRADWVSYGLNLPLRPAIQGYGVSGAEVREVAAAVPGFSIWRYDLIEPQVWRALASLRQLEPAAPADGWAAYRAEHRKFLDELAAGADAMRLANRLAARVGALPDALAADYTRLNAHFAGRG